MSDQSLAHMFFSDSYETATSRFTTLAEAANARRLSAPIPQSDHAIELALLGDVRANTLIIVSGGLKLLSEGRAKLVRLLLPVFFLKI